METKKGEKELIEWNNRGRDGEKKMKQQAENGKRVQVPWKRRRRRRRTERGKEPRSRDRHMATLSKGK